MAIEDLRDLIVRLDADPVSTADIRRRLTPEDTVKALKEVLGQLHINNQETVQINGKLDKMDSKLDKMDMRLKRVEKGMNQIINNPPPNGH